MNTSLTSHSSANDKRHESLFTRIKNEFSYGITAIILIPALIIIGLMVGGMYFMSFIGHDTNELYARNQVEEKEITARINSGNIDCQYVTDLRMKYGGDSFVNALDDSWINSKLRTYWNTHACGVEWNWWD